MYHLMNMIIVDNSSEALQHDKSLDRWKWSILNKFKATSYSSLLSIAEPVFGYSLDTIDALNSEVKIKNCIFLTHVRHIKEGG